MNIENPEKTEQETSPKSVEIIDAEIKEFFKFLDDFDYNSFSSEIQDERYDVEMEAEVAMDRETAKKRLEQFIEKLKKLSI